MARRARGDLLPVPYYHVVFTLPAPISNIAYQSKAAIYDILFKASAETLITIAADPKHLGARIGLTSVLHTWGSALTHHPHVHIVVPGGGISLDGKRWVSCRPGFFLPVRVLSRLFRRLFLEMLVAAHHAGRLQFFGDLARLAEKAAFKAYLKPLREIDWVVYARSRSPGPPSVALSVALHPPHRDLKSPPGVRRPERRRLQVQGLSDRWAGPLQDHDAGDRRVHPTFSDPRPAKGFHRIRHYGLLASSNRAENIAHARELLAVPPPVKQPETPKPALDQPRVLPRPCRAVAAA